MVITMEEDSACTPDHAMTSSTKIKAVVLLYLQVLVDEIGTVDTVGHNATHKGGGKEYIFGLFLVEEAAYGNSVEQIEFCVGLADEIGVSFLLKIFPDGRTYQSPVACYIYFGIFV